MRKLILMASLVLASSAASAQQQIVLDTLHGLDAKAPQPPAADLDQAVMSSARAFAEAHQTCAPQSVKLSDIAPITGATGIMAAVMKGTLRNAWTVYAEQVGCSSANPVRYMVLQPADGSLHAVKVNEGRTFANPIIMRDTSAGAALAALQKAKATRSTCAGEGMKMGPTRVTSTSKDLGPEVYGVRYTGTWTEVWQFETCGMKIDVPIEFTPDGDGGAYTKVVSERVSIVG